jgi:hypothetical protein
MGELMEIFLGSMLWSLKPFSLPWPARVDVDVDVVVAIVILHHKSTELWQL